MSSPARTDARARVFSALAQVGPLSRADLARQTGLAASTVSAVVSDLESDGLAVELRVLEPNDRPTVGRPGVRVALHRGAGVALGIDVGRRHVRVALADFSHTLLAERFEGFTVPLESSRAIDTVTRMAAEVLDEAAVHEGEIAGIGMGVPGPLHRASGEVGDAAILPGWDGVDVAATMSRALGHPVELENDANLGALSESMWGAGRGVEELMYLKVATGIGAGLILRGRPYQGACGTAGEIGHIIIDPQGPICRCGNRGCLETLATSPAILSALATSYGDRLSLADVLARARGGDAGCRRAIADAGRAIGGAVATVCNLLNPRLVIVGGDLIPAGDMLLEPLQEAMNSQALRSAAGDVAVVLGQLGERTDVLGAVALVLRHGAELLPPARRVA